MIRTCKAMLLLLVLAVPLACGSIGDDAAESEQISVALDWYPWANHTGLFLAEERGFFEDSDLDVNMYVPANPEDVLRLVGSGRDTFGISYQTDVLLAREQGIPVRSVAALVQQPLNSVMTLQASSLERPADLVGKTVGYPGIPSNEAYLATMLEADGASIDDVELVNVGFDLVPALIGGRVDAIIGAYWVHESILAEREGFPVNIMRVEEWGVPAYYELVVVASEGTIEDQPELVRDFIAAVSQGYQAAGADHAAAVESIMTEYPETDRALEETGIELLAPLWTAGVPSFGWQTDERWSAYADWLKSRGLLSAETDPAAAFTNEFIAED